ncbi:MAG: OpgC domain-containing protein [Oligoflexus sp.]
MSRIISIDFLRGALLLLMMFDHLLFMCFSKWIATSHITYGLFGYFTAAEGFFFLSGLVCALVFDKYYPQQSKIVEAKFKSRAKKLYSWHMLTFFIATLVIILSKPFVNYFAENPYLIAFSDQPLSSLALGSIFLSMPAFLNILPLYILYLLLGAKILKTLHNGKWRLISTLSIGLWVLAQSGVWFIVFEKLKSLINLPFNGGYFDPFAWQLLFVGGMFFGWLSKRNGLRILLTSKIIPLAAFIFYLTLWLNRHHLLPSNLQANEMWIGISNLGIIRILHFASFGLFMFPLINRYSKFFSQKNIAQLGRHSLHVFAFHVAILYVTMPMKLIIDNLSLPLSLLMLAALMASLWMPVFFRERKRKSSIGPALVKA